MSKSTSASDKTTATTDGADDDCTHHWVIEPPNGAVSKGKCKLCGIDQEFRNSFEYSSWYGTKSPNAGAKNAAKNAAAKKSASK